MATWDTADLVLRCQIEAGRTNLDEDMTAAKLYPLLSIAQRTVVTIMATRVPWLTWSAATLVTADAGKTWTETSGEWVGQIAVYRDSNRKGPPLAVGAEWDAGCFCTREGAAGIRLTVGRAQATAPYVLRTNLTAFPEISGGQAPSVTPADVRQAVVYHAVGQWAKQGAVRDPAPYFMAFNDFLYGDPRMGEPGWLGQYLTQRRSGWTGGSAWWRSGDLGR
jgi:hypothetical protein